MIIIGSPDYLARQGRPAKPDDLKDHACLRWRRSNGVIAPWSLNEPTGRGAPQADKERRLEIAVSGPFIAHDFPTLIGAAIEGVGLAQVPAPVAAAALRAGQLEEVLQPWAPLTPGVFLYYPSRHQMLPKLRAFIDHVKRHPPRAAATPQPKSRKKPGK